MSEYQLQDAFNKIPKPTAKELKQQLKEIESRKKQEALEKKRPKPEAEAARQQKKAEDERKRITLREAAAAARRERVEASERQRIEREAEKQRQKEAEESARLERIQQEAIERERKIQLNVLYRPGKEPANIRKRIDTLLPKLDAAYPDKQISGLYKEHKKWGETVTELYRTLGYPDGRAFLEAYGYTVVENKGGRSSTNDYTEAIAELQRRYPNGAGKITVEELKLANSDLPIKALQNSAKDLFGMPFGKYLKEIGIIDNE